MNLNQSGLLKGKRLSLNPVERLLVAEWAASAHKEVESCNKPLVEKILKKLGASLIDNGKGIRFE